MERDSIDFPEALRRLAQRAGVELSERTSREDAQRKRLREVLDAAIAFYHRILTESHHGQVGARLPALARLHGRDDLDPPAGLFGRRLGHAQSRALIEKRNFKLEELEAAGLVTRRRGGRGAYDRFRGANHLPHPRRERQLRRASAAASSAVRRTRVPTAAIPAPST